MPDHTLCLALSLKKLALSILWKVSNLFWVFCVVNWTVVTEAKLIWNFPIVLGFGRCFIHSGSIFVKFWQWLLGFDDRLSSKNYSSWLMKRYASLLRNTRKQTFKTLFLKRVCHRLGFLSKTAPHVLKVTYELLSFTAYEYKQKTLVPV